MPFTPRPPRRPSPSRASGPPFSRRAVLSWATGEGTPPVLRAMTAQGRPNCQAALQPWKRCLRILLLLGHVDDLNAVVISAMLAHAVGQLLFVTLRALDDAGQAELPICAALAATGLGYFSLGKSPWLHLLIPRPVADGAFQIVRLGRRTSLPGNDEADAFAASCARSRPS